MSNPAEADFRIMRYNGQYMVECLDKPVGHWYVVASKLGSGIEGLRNATNYCIEHFKIS